MKLIVLHLIDTLKYRFDHAIKNANQEFPYLTLGHGIRSPLEILYHMRGLVYYSEKIFSGKRTDMGTMGTWNEELDLFYKSLKNLRNYLELKEASKEQYFKLVQGPISDALTHVGQLAMLSRANGLPIEKQNFVHAKIGESHD